MKPDLATVALNAKGMRALTRRPWKWLRRHLARRTKKSRSAGLGIAENLECRTLLTDMLVAARDFGDHVPGNFSTDGFYTWLIDSDLDGHVEMDRLFGLAGLASGGRRHQLVAGDWDNDGDDDMGAVAVQNRNGVDYLFWYQDLDGDPSAEPASPYLFGLPRMTPVAGNFDGVGGFDRAAVDNVGNDLVWYFDTIPSTSNGNAEGQYVFSGLATAIPIAGDWNNDGTTDVGAVEYVGNNMVWHLRALGPGFTTEFTYPPITYGPRGAIPIAGNWDSNPADNLSYVEFSGSNLIWRIDTDGNYNDSPERNINYGFTTDQIVVGNFNYAEVRVFNGSTQLFDDETITDRLSQVVDFGTVEFNSTGPTRTFTVTNTGNTHLHTDPARSPNGFRVDFPAGYTLTNGATRFLSPGASDDFALRLNTSQLGTFSGTVTYHNTDGNEQDFDIRVTGRVVDTTAPAFGGFQASSVQTNATSHSFQVTYTDAVAVNTASIDGSDVYVTGPNGYQQNARVISRQTSNGGRTVVATYGTGGAGSDNQFDSRDNGTYSAILRSGQVKDTSGNAISGRVLGTFSVSAPDNVRPIVTGVSAGNVSRRGDNRYDFTVTYFDHSGIDVSTIDDTDIVVTGPGGTLPARRVSVNSSSDGSPRTATYRITPPGGIWEPASNGTYQIRLNDQQVRDTAGNAVGGGIFGSFQVNARNLDIPLNAAAIATVGNGSQWYFDLDQLPDADIDLSFGLASDVHFVAGNWDGIGGDDPGVVRAETIEGSTSGVKFLRWYLDTDGDPAAEIQKVIFGLEDHTPVTGDWDGNGITDRGAVDEVGGKLRWYFDTIASTTNGDPEDPFGLGQLHFDFGPAGATPVTGDWDGNGITDIGYVDTSTGAMVWHLYSLATGFQYPPLTYGIVGEIDGRPIDVPVVGDWNEDGADNLGVVTIDGNRDGVADLHPDGQNIQMAWLLDHTGAGVAEESFQYGLYGHRFLSGRWLYPEADIQVVGGPLVASGLSTVDLGTKTRGLDPVGKSFRITNNGNETLAIGLNSVSSGFRVTSLPSSLAPGQSDTFRVEITSERISSHGGTVSLSTSDHGNENPYVFSVTGRTVGPVPGVFGLGNGGSFDFGVVQSRIVADNPFTLRNDGDRNLTITNLTATGDFEIVEGLDTPLAPNQVDTFAVRMKTSGELGNRTGTVSFRTNDPLNSTYTIHLSGRTAELPLASSIGVVRPPTSGLAPWYLDLNRDPHLEIDFEFGLPGDMFLVGDWRNNGVLDHYAGAVRVTNDGKLLWLLDTDGDAGDELRFLFGEEGDVIQAGDFNGDGRDDVAFLRLIDDPNGGSLQVYQWNVYTGALPVTGASPATELQPTFQFIYAFAGDTPITGDWDGDGIDEPGLVSQQLTSDGLLQWFLHEDGVYEFGRAGHKPVIGDWDGDGVDDMGTIAEGINLDAPSGQNLLTWFFDTNRDPHANVTFQYGFPGDIPIAGHWLFPEATFLGPNGEFLHDGFTSDTVDFGTVRRGSTDRLRGFTVRNDGTAPLDVRLIAEAHPQFSFRESDRLQNGTTLAPLESETFAIYLNDHRGGTFEESFRFDTNDGNEDPFDLFVRGRVEGPIAGVAAASNGSTRDLGQVNLDVQLERTFTLHNFGTETLEITEDVIVSDRFYVVDGLPDAIAPGGFAVMRIGMETDTVTVDADNQPAPREGLLTFRTNDPKSSLYQIHLTGEVAVFDVSDIGVFLGNRWLLDIDRDPAAELSVPFGLPGDTPVTGNWNGGDLDNVGIVREGPGGRLFWYLNLDDDAAAEIVVEFGNVGDIPVVGDWNGDGQDNLGVVRNVNGTWQWLLDLNYDVHAEQIFNFGDVSDGPNSQTQPVVGKWRPNDNRDHFAIVRKDRDARLYHWQFDTDRQPDVDYEAAYGDYRVGHRIVTGDWNGDGLDDVGAVQNGTADDPLLTWFLGLNTGTGSLPEVDPHADIEVRYGFNEHTLVTGRWLPPRQRPEVAGTVWIDLDEDGVQDAGEPGRAGITVYIDANFDGVLDRTRERFTVTNADGEYVFADLLPGSHPIAIESGDEFDGVFPGEGTRITEGHYAGIFNENADLAQQLLVSLTPDGVADNEYSGPVEDSATSGTHGRSLIGLPEFQAERRFRSVDGSGFAVVVIDTGIDRDHAAFGPDLNRDGIADRIIYQQDFFDDDNVASDFDGHGTHVTGIVAAEGTGIVPGVDIIHLKVFPDERNQQTSQQALEKALQWVVGNAGSYPIVAVNLSLGGDSFPTAQSGAQLGDEFAALAELGIITVAAAGNAYRPGQSPGIAYPAADPNVISVGAVYADDTGNETIVWPGATTDRHIGSDVVAGFSQRHIELLDVFAPGVYIEAPGLNGGRAVKSGSSQAAPYVTGAAVIAQQLAIQRLGRRLSVTEFRDLLRETGVDIRDNDDEDSNVTPVTAGTDDVIPRLNLLSLADGVLDRALDNSHVVRVGLSDVEPEINFGLRFRPSNVGNAQGIIAGTVFDDTNQNGRQDDGETGRSDHTIRISSDLLGSDMTLQTGSDGTFRVVDLPYGPYEISLEGTPLNQQTSPIDRTFRGVQVVTQEAQPTALATADFSGDGFLDVAVVGIGAREIDVLINSTGTNQPPSFVAAPSLPLPSRLANPTAVAAADVSGNGRAWIAIGTQTDSQSEDFPPGGGVVIYRNTGGSGASRFVEHQIITGAGIRPHSMESADLDRDGHLDFVFSNSSSNHLTILWNDGSDNFTREDIAGIGFGQRGIAVVQLNTDSRPDLVVADAFDPNVQAVIVTSSSSTGRGFNSPIQVTGTGGPVSSVTSGDFDGDGDQDILAGRRIDANNLTVIENTGASTFSVHSPLTLSSTQAGGSDKLTAVASRDINDDGFDDIVATLENSPSLYVLFNEAIDAGIQFRRPVAFEAASLPQGAEPSGIVLGDFDNDDDIDVITANLVGTVNDGIISVFEDRQTEGSYGITLGPGTPERNVEFGTVDDRIPVTIQPDDWDDRGLTVEMINDRLHFRVTGTSLDVVPPRRPNGITSISIQGRDNADDDLTVRLPAGSLFASIPFSFDGGTGTDGVRVVRAATPVDITLDATLNGRLDIGSDVLSLTDVEVVASANETVRRLTLSDADESVLIDTDRATPRMTVTSNGSTLHVEGFTGSATVIDLGAGSDLLEVYAVGTPFAGAVSLLAGPGDDVVRIDRRLTHGVTIDAGPGTDCVSGGSGPDQIDGGDGDDDIDGGAGSDVIDAGDGSDVVRGGRGDDIIEGGAGNDLLNGNAGMDVLSGGAGHDILNGHSNDDVLRGGPGRDLLRGGRGNDDLDGGDDDDHLSGQHGNDLLNGGAGNDRLRGDAGNDVLTGSLGNDMLSGGRGRDTLHELVSGTGPVVLSGRSMSGLGADRHLRVELARIDGDGSANSIDALLFSGPVTLTGGDGDDTLVGTRFDDLLDGGAGRDSVTRQTSDDVRNAEVLTDAAFASLVGPNAPLV